MDAALIDQVKRKYNCLAPEMDERRLRQWAAVEARELGYGEVTIASNATGLSRPRSYRGIRELAMPLSSRIEEGCRIRKPEAGGRPLIVNDPDLIEGLEALVDPVTRGVSESPLRWTCKSTRKLAPELIRLNHPISE